MKPYDPFINPYNIIRSPTPEALFAPSRAFAGHYHLVRPIERFAAGIAPRPEDNSGIMLSGFRVWGLGFRVYGV